MKRHGYLYEQLTSFENIFLAFKKAMKGKKRNPNVAEFACEQELNLLNLQSELRYKTYQPGKYRTFIIYEKKPRMISAAPFRDRVVHHALCNMIEPIFEKSFIFDSYANRRGKGTHRAVKRCSQFARLNKYVLKCDIKKYFPSIDHEILKKLIRKKIKDPDVLWLVDAIIDNSNQQEVVFEWFTGDDLFSPIERRKGLPIGNQTSQFFANVYLNEFDHFVKDILGCKYYLRYVDDFLMFNDSKAYLWKAKEIICKKLAGFRLKMHENKVQVLPVKCGIPFLGYRIYPEFRRIDSENVTRFRKRMKELQVQYSKGEIGLQNIHCSISGWLGHAMHANSYRLRQSLFSDFVIRN